MTPSSSEIWHDPALPYVESRRACHSRACYKAHSHPSFSIGAVDAGHSRFTGAGDGQVRLAPGTLVFVPAQRVHACNPEAGQAWSYQMLHLDADWLRCLRLESGIAADQPSAAARISHSAALYRRFCTLNTLLFSRATAFEKEAALVAFLGDNDFSIHPHLPPAPPLPPSTLRDLLGHAEEQTLAELSLDRLARLAGMGRYQLIRAFSLATGMTPHAYLLNARVNKARQLLRQGQPLAEVAYGLGFADQSHFQRVFKAHAGVTPGTYRAALQ
ncbi:AraC family transcriptional regulator [Pseudomonas mosselii]|uniref:AraC family transcriptional regulator n=1 Tax=Pseudomonas mosselii TaxID=78327 RepID=UPI0007809C0F|nr:AraC family transcriptional regulator [Pseudomonas mosselii]KXG80371.1 AraC family transcriptional regulator [Pseudomonas mosselii]MDH0630701.1 AraC family transcriptional regulator [Pseudomonas mosselii]MDH0677601.1 AraC family transcriptional regulator [Pseudomonas mosselii]MDH0925629.1 AraC family transcriptional regulator [Pseudomonas mosselii]MDH1134974.1 AraC family transcriptional regulator [Pseudomonas mosselii]